MKDRLLLHPTIKNVVMLTHTWKYSAHTYMFAEQAQSVKHPVSDTVSDIMRVLRELHLVPAQFWRAAGVSAIILSAIITPDGSGVTMAILSGPLFLLYGAGVLFIK